jgi:hypothetical protein
MCDGPTAVSLDEQLRRQHRGTMKFIEYLEDMAWEHYQDLRELRTQLMTLEELHRKLGYV